jgi:hypothetical protein
VGIGTCYGLDGWGCIGKMENVWSSCTHTTTIKDYVQETYSELEFCLFLTLQTFLRSHFIRTSLSEDGQNSIQFISSTDHFT